MSDFRLRVTPSDNGLDARFTYDNRIWRVETERLDPRTIEIHVIRVNRMGRELQRNKFAYRGEYHGDKIEKLWLKYDAIPAFIEWYNIYGGKDDA